VFTRSGPVKEVGHVVSVSRPDHEHFQLDVAADGTIIVHGDIDIATGPVLEEAITTREASGGSIVIDLGNVDFIDSSGLRTLLSASGRARDNDARVTLRKVGPEVARLLDLTSTTGQFEIESSRD
jgi:anti-anti-sigma factor